LSRLPQQLEAVPRIEHRWAAAIPEPQMLGPQRDAKVAGVASYAADDGAVYHVAVDLAVIGHAAVAEIAGADAGPYIAAQYDSGSHMGRWAGPVAQVEHQQAAAALFVGQPMREEGNEPLAQLVEHHVGEFRVLVQPPRHEDGDELNRVRTDQPLPQGRRYRVRVARHEVERIGAAQ